MPVVPISTIKRKYDKWGYVGKLKKLKYVKILMNDQNIMLGYPPSMEKLGKSKNVNQLILMNVWNSFSYTPFYLGNIIYLAKILRALFSNKNGILHFWKKSIIQ